MDRIAALPAGGVLVERLADTPGVYLVGGAVRDLLLGIAPHDLDVAVEGDAVALAHRLGGQIRAHGRFGTCTATVDGVAYDLARTRRERYAQPGALPDVEPASLTEDLARRDFTVNAIAIALAGPEAGSVIAVPDALEDLGRRRLRVMHAGSFVDDPTRLLRLARYAGRLDFTVPDETRALAGAAIAGDALASVSGPRIGAELRLLAREPETLAGFGWLAELGIDHAIHPAFGVGDFGLARAALQLVPEDGRPDRVILALASLDVPANQIGSLLQSLDFPAADRDIIARTSRGARQLAERLGVARTSSQIADAVGDAPVEAVALAGALGAARPAAQWLGQLRHVRLDIGGADLIAAGIAPGPAIGRGLQAALAAKLDGQAGDAEGELACALAAARGAGETRHG
jgi:tRNA nucleotidyltransferase (CCA-adding enzyme)